MMRKSILLLASLALSVSVYADPVAVDFVRFGSSGLWQNGYPYWAVVQGSGFLPVMCDDYEHGGDPGFVWLANQTNLGSQTLTQTRFGNMSGALTLYDEAGWILLQTRATGINQWQDMNYAVWHIFDPSSPLNPGAQSWLTAAQDQAGKGFPDVNFDLVGILTPAFDQFGSDPNGPQELLYLVGGVGPNAIDLNHNQGGSSPEPATWVLFGTGLVAVLRWKRFA